MVTPTPQFGSFARAPQRVRRAVLRHRRGLAAIAAGLAVLTGIQALRPAAPEPAPRAVSANAPTSFGMRLAASGLTPVPVRFPDSGAAALLAVGDRITVLATGSEMTSAVVADGVEVLALPQPVDNRSAIAAGNTGRVVVLGLSDEQVAPVTAASVAAVLTFGWDR